MIMVALLIGACLLAMANGANDNFKGVASIYGSGVASYRTSVVWATIWTLAGSRVSVFLATALLKNFSGKGLVPNALTADPRFLFSVTAGAGITVLLATRLGFPISTTHALVGALIGVGVAGRGIAGVNFAALGYSFVLPLLLSPVLAVAAGSVLYTLLHGLRWSFGLTKQWCVCVGTRDVMMPMANGSSMLAMRAMPAPVMEFSSSDVRSCTQKYVGQVAGFDVQRLVDACHFGSAGVVSFARGLNDTPKIAALLILLPWTTRAADLVLVSLVMAAGGVMGARRVAETMSHRITTMSPGQGLTSNLATATLVLLASFYGLPVSTTHVAVGSLFGIGLTTGQANARTMSGILLSWVVTLPCAAILGAAAYQCLNLLAA